jgi:hypothetical protein
MAYNSYVFVININDSYEKDHNELGNGPRGNYWFYNYSSQ